MNITITGSLGNISKPLAQQLIAKGHQVTIISRQPEKAAAIKALGAIPAIGSVDDTNFLLQAFANADAVYTMIPPDYQTNDIRGYMKETGERYANAIKQSGVKHVVNLSAIGAHKADGPGPTSANYYIEQHLNALENTNVLHVRPGMFYSNFYGAIDMIRHQHIIGNNFDAGTTIVMSHPEDIATAIATALDRLDFNGKTVRYVASDEKTGGEIATILGNAIGQPNLAWIGFSDNDLLQGMLQSGMSEQMAKVYIIEIGVALREDTLFTDYRQHQQQAFGERSFTDFAKEFAFAYNGHQ